MEKTRIAAGASLLSLVLVLPLIAVNPVEASGWDQGNWGRSGVIHVCDAGNPVNNTELTYVQWVTDEIMTWCFEPKRFIVIWGGQAYDMGPAYSYFKNYMENYESSTSYSNVIADVTRGENHDCYFPFATFLYIGHHAYQYGAVSHYGFLGHGKNLPIESPSIDKIWDHNIYYTVSNLYHRFVFLWVCRNGNERGSYHPSPDLPNGMPYCWTHGEILSENGYDNPDYTDYCLISFEQMSPMICEYLDPTITQLRHKHWLAYFYYATLEYDNGYPINDALDWASLWCDYTNGFPQTKLYQGGEQWYPGGGGFPPNWSFSKMRIYGDGTMNVPGDLVYVYQ